MFIDDPRTRSTEDGVNLCSLLYNVTKTHIPGMVGQISLKSYVSSVGGFSFANLPSLSSKGSVERILPTNFKNHSQTGSSSTGVKWLNCQVVPAAASSFRR